MILSYNKNFQKMFKKKNAWLQDKFEERALLFQENQYDVLLNNHALSGEYVGCRSINITGDVRAIYEEIKDNHFEFVAIGTHTELYG